MRIEIPKVRFNKSRKKWYVDLRYHGGKRETCRTKEQAQAKAKKAFNDLVKHGENRIQLPVETLTDVKRGLELLKPFNASIFKAVEHYVEHLKQRHVGSVTLAKALDDWLIVKEGQELSKAHLINIRSRIKRLKSDHGSRALFEIDHPTMYNWLKAQKLANTSKNDFNSCYTEFFEWCIYEKAWLQVNPCKKIEFKVIEKEVPIFDVEEARELWNAAKESDPDIRRHVLLCLFCGLRPKWEARKFSRDDILASSLRVISSKTLKLRYVEPGDKIMELLKYPIWDGATQAINFRKRWDAFRESLGYRVKASDKKRKLEWEHDIMRHSFCSYHLAAFQNEANSAHQAGHTIKIFRKNYKRPIPKKDGERFWAILG
jgi:site-specific recombinase XerD